MATNIKYDMKMFQDWLISRPKCIQEMAEKYPPNRLYRLTKTGQRVTLASYSEDGTVRIHVLPEFNKERFEGLTDMCREVFGVNPNDLAECDLPDYFDNSKEEWTNQITLTIIATKI